MDEFAADLLTLTDDEGVEMEFQILDQIETEDGTFMALLPVEEAEDEDENGSYNTDEVNAALDIFIELSGEEWTDEQLGYLWETRASALSKSNPYGRALLGTPWYQRKKEEGNTWMRERE